MARRDACAALKTGTGGLAEGEAAVRLADRGPNTIPRTPPQPAWRILAAQFRSVVVLLLAGAIVGSLLTGDRADTIAVSAVLAIDVALGFFVEVRARRAVEALGRLEVRHATVLRDGRIHAVDASTLVPGDLLVLESGSAIPADARIVEGVDLRVVEAPLTGESVPVAKRADPPAPEDASLPERVTMLYAGTMVAAGSARAVVVATGADTELGAIGRLVGTTARIETPLSRRLDALGRQMVWLALAIGGATAALAWRQGAGGAAILESAIALAVAAVPEGLPVVTTMTLALGVHRMATRRAVVRNLPAVETLGSVTVICTDKTGTLTAGAMLASVIALHDRTIGISGDGYDPAGAFVVGGAPVAPETVPDLRLALATGLLANRGDIARVNGRWAAIGDPTDAALVVAARKAGLVRSDLLAAQPEVAEVPFSSERMYAATMHRVGDRGVHACVKGALRQVLARCTRLQVDGRAQDLTDDGRATIQATNATLAGRGLRVLALAHGAVETPTAAALHELTFIGLVGMSDPPAPGVVEALGAFRAAGIATVMITGDQAATASAIARDLGLAADAVAVDGHTIDALPDDELRARIGGARVFSRISPRAKLRIVEAYQRRGEIVAMLGDGVNDAPALKRADVGVTMGGRGTDVARETADVVLQDDRFETIGVAIEQGRIIFDNIRKFVFYLFSCNLAEVIVLLGTSAIGLPLPLQPIQVLWLNIVTDTGPALALAVEPAGGDVMRRPPRHPQEAFFSGAFLRSVAGYAALIAGATFLVMAWGAWAGIDRAEATTMNFMVLALAQLFHLGNARDAAPVLTPARILANPAALLAVCVGVLVQAGMTVSGPIAALIGVVPLGIAQWAVVIGASAIPAVVGQAIKVVTRPVRA